ncbi:RHS repeat-associated core domain-containing protein [Leptolyngbyaceae cyanobacterium UHCC 1019]
MVRLYQLEGMILSLCMERSPLQSHHFLHLHYRYDAFGKNIGETGAVDNKYLFAGEQFDSNLGDYYLRQRYYDTDSGRFTRRDTYEGRQAEPLTLHKYSYTHNNPINGVDPSGLLALTEFVARDVIFGILAAIKVASITTGSYNPERLGGFGEDARPRTVLDSILAWRNTWTPEPLGGVGGGSSPSVPSHTGRSAGDINDFVQYVFSINIDVAYDIAYQHAWPDHRGEFQPIGINSAQELAELIESIMMNPSDQKSSGHRTAYWDDNTGTIVIENPEDPHGGTAFRPRNKKEFFDVWPDTKN